MKILFLTNNYITISLYNWLKEREDVVLYEKKVYKSTVESIDPDFIISYNYKHIISKEVIDLLPRGKIINLHISFLPWNRGAYPNVWSFVDNTPKGVTIHLIDEGIDTGDILIQKEIFIDEEKHTLRSSYELLNREIQELFKENWELIKNLKLKPVPQKGKGTFHSIKEFKEIKKLIEDKGWDIPISEFKERIRRYYHGAGNKNR